MRLRQKVKYDRMVIKIQKPLFFNSPAEAMIYNEDRSLMTFLPWTQELDDQFADDLKQYWLAGIPQTTGYIQLIKQVEERDW